MTVRVRFAPSPTGYLHIGGARTAMYNYLFAKAMGGKYILRIEDTDTDRSKREYEDSQISDLKWLGISHDEGPDVGGDFGPYRQSERGEIYKAWAEKLLSEGKAFHCYCSEEELKAKREKAESEKGDPNYDGHCHHLTADQIAKYKAEGREAVIRFKAPKKDYEFVDKVRGKVHFPEGMIGDFVIMRANGIPVYNYAVVVDDATMKISHVIRAEEHLPNTLRQLMLYEAYGITPPEFCHVSLLIGEDRQKLSKRHGATSVSLYRDDHYLPQAMLNYLLLLGWSHPEEKDVFDVFSLGTNFNLDRFTKSPAIYDINKLKFINGQHIRLLANEQIVAEVKKLLPENHAFLKQTADWQIQCVNIFKEKMEFFSDLKNLVTILFETHISDEKDYLDAMTWETTPKIREYLKSEVLKIKTAGQSFVSLEAFNAWGEHVKNELKIKGKPLFMGMRAVLTHQAHGTDLKFIIPLTPIDVLLDRLNK
jgi:glutamyl-tRNA synthetase